MNTQLFRLHPATQQAIFIGCTLLCLFPFVSPAMALLLGIAVAQFTGHPYIHLNHKATHILLQVSVVGLGFGMSFHSAIQAGKEGFVFTMAAIGGTLTLGVLLGRWLKIDHKTAFLISSGTAICGGSAIAAIAPVIKAKEQQISVALGCVFILNAIALFIFPVIGHYFHLSQVQFGLWSAIAIHDTSSVVGAAGKYGAEALEVATAVKLARALWIIPVALLASLGGGSRKISIPWFILLFVVAMLINGYLPGISPYLVTMAKAGLTLTLFLIGAGLSREVLAAVGVRPMVQGVVLWMVVSGVSLWAIVQLV